MRNDPLDVPSNSPYAVYYSRVMKPILFVLLAVAAFAQQPKIQHPNEQWKPLFNGEDLTG